MVENNSGAASYVVRILAGAKGAELPIQEPTEIKLAINMRTARAIRLTIPPALLARAGLTYPMTIFEGESGFAKMVSGPLDETILRQRSGDFQILKSCIKLWPCVGTAQAPIAATLDAASNLRAQDRMRELAARPDLIIPGHDPAVMTRFKSVAPGVVKIE